MSRNRGQQSETIWAPRKALASKTVAEGRSSRSHPINIREGSGEPRLEKTTNQPTGT